APEPAVKRLLFDADKPPGQPYRWKGRVLRCPARYGCLADPQQPSDLLRSEERHTRLNPQRLQRPSLSAGTLATAPQRLHLRYATSAASIGSKGSTLAPCASSLDT